MIIQRNYNCTGGNSSGPYGHVFSVFEQRNVVAIGLLHTIRLWGLGFRVDFLVVEPRQRSDVIMFFNHHN